MATKYSEKKDKIKDRKMMKGMTPKQKAAFRKLDDKHKKVKTMEADAKIDRKLIKQVKKKVKK